MRLICFSLHGIFIYIFIIDMIDLIETFLIYGRSLASLFIKYIFNLPVDKGTDIAQHDVLHKIY